MANNPDEFEEAIAYYLRIQTFIVPASYISIWIGIVLLGWPEQGDPLDLYIDWCNINALFGLLAAVWLVWRSIFYEG
jgi:hypothetical protein